MKISILLLFLASSVLAQSPFRGGYIITNNNETIYGEVKDRLAEKNYRSCLFKAKDGKVTEYYPQKDLKGYGFVGDKFFSSEIKDGFFVEVLIDGLMSLYKFNEVFYLRKDTNIHLLASKKEEVKINGNKVIKESNWKGVTSYLISDCQLNSDIKNLRFEENSLVKTISSYNKCKGNDFVVFKGEKPFALFNYGISFGLVNSTIRTESYPQPRASTIDYMNDSYSSVDPIIGLAFTAASPRTSENFAFHFGINFMKSNYSSLYVKKEAQQIQYNESYIRLTTINVPAYLKYTFPTRLINFSLLVGGIIDSNIKSYSHVYMETVVENSFERIVITHPDMEAFSIKRNQIGSMLGVGFQREFSEYSLGAYVHYIRMSTLSESPGLEVKISRISFSIVITKL